MNGYDMSQVIDGILSDPDVFDLEDEDMDEDEASDWYPETYCIMFNGFRGGGKSLGVCWFGCWHLKYRDDVPVYTDLDYKIESLERDGFKSLPIVLDWDKLITFNLDQPIGSMNQIDEVDTKIDKLRTVANQNVVATKFLEQIRKHERKMVFACQFGHYLPYGTLDQVDLLVHCHDLFFTPAGRSYGLKKGERFLYIAEDKSGYFTGGRTNIPICFTLDGRGIWDYYRSEKIHDVLQFAKKYRWKSEEYIINEDGEGYPGTEDKAQDQERKLRQMRETVSTVWGGQFMSWVMANPTAVRMSENGDHITITDESVKKALLSVTGPRAKALEKSYSNFKLITEKGGVVRRRHGVFDILKPENFAREDEEVVPGPTIGQNEAMWSDDYK